ncbi:hypothetical protein GGS23DRAFT_580188 [Durotheca rogersii]|uniref:uncharacterized protein n=1 Tax=Durotheca rogersii TaxID=419775 RepID=UPI002220A243|nr:uncharacterized protein GGS23DRAFT_580188 [Durotheca rogersii]KAI5860462.1 hypothetical protein GGS23DRAFT_580188 [Durotheca rogersii]
MYVPGYVMVVVSLLRAILTRLHSSLLHNTAIRQGNKRRRGKAIDQSPLFYMPLLLPSTLPHSSACLHVGTMPTHCHRRHCHRRHHRHQS